MTESLVAKYTLKGIAVYIYSLRFTKFYDGKKNRLRNLNLIRKQIDARGKHVTIYK